MALFLAVLPNCDKEVPHAVDDLNVGSDAVFNRTEDSVQYEYRIDLALSLPFSLDEEDPGNIGYRHVTESLLDSNGQVLLIMHKFSNDSLYYEYGESKGLDPRLHDQIADRLAFLADSLNMDSIVDVLDSIPAWWDALEVEVS